MAALAVAGGIAVASETFGLVIEEYGSAVTFVSLNDDGTMMPLENVENPTTIQYGAYGIGIGDFDNDGLDDFISGGNTGYTCNPYCNYYPTRIDFHRRTGEGDSFDPGVPIQGAGGWYYYVMDFAVADYNSDGNLDFAVNDFDARRAHVYFGHGDGTFDVGPVFELGADFNAIAMDAADVNNDGNADFVSAQYYSYDNGCYYYDSSCLERKRFDVFLGDGNGGFTMRPFQVAFPRIHTPLSYNNYYYYDYSYTWGLALGDYDGDGNVDLAATEYMPQGNNGNVLMIFRGNGDGTFETTPIRTGGAYNNEYWAMSSIDNGDFNGDGVQDLLFSSMNDQSVRTYLGNGDGTFSLASWLPKIGARSSLTGVSTAPGERAYDRRKPVVTFADPGALTNNPTLAIVGTATDSGGVVSVEAVRGTDLLGPLAPAGNNQYTGTVHLVEGRNELQLRATDRAGNTGLSESRVVTLDTIKPTVALPSLPQFATDEHFTLTASADDVGSGVASVKLLLNGNVVPATLSGNAVNASLTLIGGTNEFELSALDHAGNEATHVFGSINLDDEGPSVALVALPAFTNVPAQTIRGTATDNQGIASLVLTVDGSQVDAPFVPGADGTFSRSVSLGEGPHTIAVKALDRAGLAGSDSVQTNLDTVPPNASLDAFTEYTNVVGLAASGHVSDNNSGVARAQLKVVGGASSGDLVSTDGSVSALLSLTEGRQTIVLEVTDRAGNVGATSADITLDTVPPVIAIATPREHQPFGDLRIPVAADVADATPTVVGFGGFEINLPDGGGRAAGFVDATGEGANDVVVRARDAAGNTAQAHVGFVVDLSAPVATFDLQGIADGAAIGPQPGDQVLYTVRVDDITSVHADTSWGASFDLPEGGGVQQGAAPLTEGRNTFALVLADVLGHETHLLRSVTYDVTPPTASLSGLLAVSGSPARGTVELAADATDNLTGVAAANFEIDGAATPATASGTTFGISLDTTTLTDGIHAVKVTFVDGVGNAKSLSSSILVDNTAPVAAITAPAANAYLRQTISLTATASDATSGLARIDIAVNGRTVGGCATSPCTVSFDTTTLANGPFLISASARDVAGNSTDATPRSAIADNTAPSKFLVSPIAGATVSGSVTVSVDVVDDAFASVECTVDGASLGVSTSPTFTQTVNLLGKLDGAVVVSCSATDLAGNVGTESATVRLKNWKLDLDPKTLNVKSNGNEVKLVITGPNLSVLLPATDKALSLVVAGGSPAPLMPRKDGYAVKDGALELKFDRAALVSAIKAGIATGAINPAQPLTVRFFSGNREMGSDTIKVEGTK